MKHVWAGFGGNAGGQGLVETRAGRVWWKRGQLGFYGDDRARFGGDTGGQGLVGSGSGRLCVRRVLPSMYMIRCLPIVGRVCSVEGLHESRGLWAGMFRSLNFMQMGTSLRHRLRREGRIADGMVVGQSGCRRVSNK